MLLIIEKYTGSRITEGQLYLANAYIFCIIKYW